MFRSWFTRLKPRPYYSQENVRVGAYIIGTRNIRFIPIDGMHINCAIKACIDLSNEHKMPTYMFFSNNIKIDVPYPTSNDDATIQIIADKYHSQFKAKVMGRRNRVK